MKTAEIKDRITDSIAVCGILTADSDNPTIKEGLVWVMEQLSEVDVGLLAQRKFRDGYDRGKLDQRYSSAVLSGRE